MLIAYETCNIHFRRIDVGLWSDLNRLSLEYIIEHDREILSDYRYKFIEQIDRALVFAGSFNTIRPILEEHIIRVKDQKLSTLLKEFNNSRSAQPNISAIAFRTIISLIISQRAIIISPTSQLATKQDLALEPDINAALRDKIFSEGPARMLKRFRDSGRKDIFDNIAHKKDDQSLIVNDDLSDAVDLLNVLLPSIL